MKAGLMTPSLFLLLNIALAFYNVGTIWAHEADIFRSWRLVDPQTFRRIQAIHWRKLPYWIFAPAGFAFLGSLMLLWYHPSGTPLGLVEGAFACILTSHVLTALLWGRWQAKLSQDERGGASPYLTRILSTHWIRTGLINAYALMLLGCGWRLWA